MIDKVNLKKCIQCENCKNICPINAISMNRKEAMFIYPMIDNEKCIKCQKCENVCPVLNPLKQQGIVKSYAVKHKNEEIRLESSSGGLFTALAKTIIDRGGYVFGAAFQENFSVKHIGINSKEKIQLLRGSKYVQSNLTDIFVEIDKLLKDGKVVLFSGTPCQCAAIRNFTMGKEYDGDLFVVDFICHGILSEDLFMDYIQYLEKREKSKIESFKFRNKRYGWIDSGPEVIYSNGKIKRWPLYEDLYMQGYFQGLCMRESCYTCQYKNFHSGSDITMGDFWGADVLAKDFYDKSGVSLCCVQSDKGEKLLNVAKINLDIKEMPLDIIIKYNQGLIYPFKKGEKSSYYFRKVEKEGTIKALEKVTKLSKIEKIKRLYRKIRREYYNR